MADKRIDDATPDTQVTGVEKFPVSDGGMAKYATTAQVKDYTLAQIAAIAAASGIDLSTDGVYLLKGGALKPVSSETLATAVLDYGFGKVAVASMNGNEVVGVKDSATQKTITVSQLKAWLQDNMTITTDIDIGAKDAAGALSANDILVIAQSGTNKKLTLTTLSQYVHGAFKDYVVSLTAVTNLSDSDVLYVVNGTTAKKCTVADLKTIIGTGDVVAPSLAEGETWAGHVVGRIPAWDNADKTLTKGFGVASNISGQPSATKIPTEAAVSSFVSGGYVEKVEGKGLSSNDYTNEDKQKVASTANISTWTAGRSYAVGDYCLYGTYLNRCIHAGATESFNPDDWEYIPGYPSSDADTKFLRGDGSWAVPPTATNFVGATSEAAGSAGLVPAPAIADKDKYIKGDGSWSDPIGTCAKAPATTTENKVPQWDSVGKFLKDGLKVVKSTDTLVQGEGDVSIPTVNEVGVLIGQATGSVSVIHGSTSTAGKIPKFETTATAQQEKSIVDGYGVKTSVGSSPTDTDIPTEKAVSDFVSNFVGIEKLMGLSADGAGLSGTTATLTNNTSHRFGFTAGTNYTLVVPAAVDGKMREFYVAFNFTGAADAQTVITFSNGSANVNVITSAGLGATMTVKKVGSSLEYHAYHFFEEAGNLVCENVFAAAEEGSNANPLVPFGITQAVISQDNKVSVKPRKMMTLSLGGTEPSIEFVPDLTGITTGGMYESYMNVSNEGQGTPTITVDESIEVMLPPGKSSIGELCTAGKCVRLKIDTIVIDGGDSLICGGIIVSADCEIAL